LNSYHSGDRTVKQAALDEDKHHGFLMLSYGHIPSSAVDCSQIPLDDRESLRDPNWNFSLNSVFVVIRCFVSKDPGDFKAIETFSFFQMVDRLVEIFRGLANLSPTSVSTQSFKSVAIISKRK